LPGQTLVTPDSHIQGAGQGFEKGFGPVVIVSADQQPGMQVQPAFVGDALKKMGDKRRAHLANALGAESAVEDKVTATTKNPPLPGPKLRPSAQRRGPYG
jgi:hypothetical protein